MDLYTLVFYAVIVAAGVGIVVLCALLSRETGDHYEAARAYGRHVHDSVRDWNYRIDQAELEREIERIIARAEKITAEEITWVGAR